jgi:hypothetical protein
MADRGAGRLEQGGEAGGVFRGAVLMLLMVLNSRQKFLGPKKIEEGIASLFPFSGPP